MSNIPLIGTFPLPLEREILKYLPNNELVALASEASPLEMRIRATFTSLVRQANETISKLGEVVLELKAHPDFQIKDCTDDKEPLEALMQRDAEQSRRLNSLFHNALMSYGRLGEKALVPDHLNVPIVEQLKALYVQKSGHVVEVALASLAASPGICDICTNKTGGKKTMLCATVRITLFGPNREEEIYTVHVEATKTLKEGIPSDLELMDDKSGKIHTYWALPIQEKQHQNFPKFFPEGPFHKAHVKMVAQAYRTHCA